MDIVKLKKKSDESIIKLKLIFSTQAFSISELNNKIKIIQAQKNNNSNQIELKNDDSDNEQKKSGFCNGY